MQAVILIGIQASGKSSFYRERFFDTHVRINLDMLKTRAREKILLEACLSARQRFVVDNTNILISDRAPYIALAHAARFTVTGYYFESSLADALRRNRLRAGKAAVPDLGVLAKYKRMQPPAYAEGFDQLFVVTLREGDGFEVNEK